MGREISEGRKTLYYVGMALIVIGFLVFGSVMLSGAQNFGNFDDFEERTRSEGVRAIVGMALMIAGGLLTAIGRHGLAGSGLLLDPQRARQDLEPHSRMAGGMVKDALDEAGVDLGGRGVEVVKIKCPGCGHLNDEDSKFCQECGRPL
ncbi:MAG: zinc ribbon domain-containing protein [Planctomycetia bacterium]|jgi:hypothetical protein